MSSVMHREREGRIIGGVCAGFAEHTGLPVAGVRVGTVLLTLLGGLGLVLYVWLWILVPEAQGEGGPSVLAPLRDALTRPAPAPQAPAPHAQRDPAFGDSAPRDPAQPRTFADAPEPERGAGPRASSRGGRLPIAEILLGGCLTVAGVALVLVQLGVRIPLEVILPGMVVLAGVGLAWWQIADGGGPGRSPFIRLLGALALVAAGVLMFFITAREPNLWTIVAAAVAVLAGVALALAPWLVRLNRDLLAERAGRAREAERAEIAAHLHDSVLQTLALIQQQSGPGSDVSRLARRQEQELRDWLFRGADSSDGGESTQPAEAALRAHAVALESEHAVRFELVPVGAAGAQVPDSLLGAAREAMLNAARHAGGDVTVYLEVTPTIYAIDVTDRGPGLGTVLPGFGPAGLSAETDAAGLPDGRMGVRASILGRMARAGGTARILPGPGGTGTTVRLALPRERAAETGPIDTDHQEQP
ncbi:MULTISPECIES: ATP-binding protein [unclassified Leucobacter]|uniref:ATP-binding protein n=1 Tax=unclassified Leucobacter TaxID=2621730 RepID=UPI001F12A972|nr:ATP-binding protein [Leucobacter sp. CX169]